MTKQRKLYKCQKISGMIYNTLNIFMHTALLPLMLERKEEYLSKYSNYNI